METNDQLLRAVQVATRKLASSGNFNALLKDVLSICVDAVGASGGTIYLHDPSRTCLVFQHVLPEEIADKLPSKDIPEDYGLAGKAFQGRMTVTREFDPKPMSEANDFERATGVIVRSMIATPLMMEDETPIGVVQLINKKSGCFTDNDSAVLETVAAVSTMAYLNFRLTDEASRASTLLGMGKVSHDMGNLAASLHATLAYSSPALDGLKEVIPDGPDADHVKMYVDMLSDMVLDLHTSIDRIVGYSRLVSDLSVGRALRPNKKLAPLAQTIQTSAAYLEPDGRRNHVALRYEIQDDAPPLLHDELYLFRIVQNLVGNAIKAVKETIPDDWADKFESDEDTVYGEVVISYHFKDDKHVIEVHDTGPGMSQDTARRILTGNARSQWDKGTGSGWGTKIVLELAATHNATVDIDSEVGQGATFRITFPHITEEPASA